MPDRVVDVETGVNYRLEGESYNLVYEGYFQLYFKSVGYGLSRSIMCNLSK